MTAEAGARPAHEHHARGVRRVPAFGLIFNYEPIDRVFNRLGVTVFGANCLVCGKNTGSGRVFGKWSMRKPG